MTVTPRVGRLYLLRGGHLLRYEGAPLNAAIIRELTTADADFLRNRYLQATARDLPWDAEQAAEFLTQLGLEVP